MGERRGTKALELWCRRVTDGYPGVNVSNMTTAWKDGLAFCALIHRFRPDLIDFASLRSSQARSNNELAFRVAERHLGIPALLDAEDMVDTHAPDRLSVLTYLAQYYQAFGQASLAMGIISPVRGSTPKRQDSSGSEGGESPRPPGDGGGETPTAKKVWHPPTREPCSTCGLPVFLAERLSCSGRTFHRRCFRCARCGGQLSPANCYETESHEFCCEVCPDEEATPREDKLAAEEEPAPRRASSTDTEEASGTESVTSHDEYSADLEAVLEGPDAHRPSITVSSSSQQSEEQELPVTHTSDLPPISTHSPVNMDHAQVITNHPCSTSDVNQTNGHIVDSELKICDSGAQTKNDVNELKHKVVDDGEICPSVVELRKSSSDSDRSSRSSLVSSRKSLFESMMQTEEPPKLVAPRKISPPSNSTNEDLNLSTSTANSSLGTTHTDVNTSLNALAITSGSTEMAIKKSPDVTPRDQTTLSETQVVEEVKVEPPTPVVVVEEPEEEHYPDDLNPFGEEEEGAVVEEGSTNPFGSDEEEDTPPLRPKEAPRRVIPVDAHLNPFWEEGMEEEDKPTPVPRPRSFRGPSPEAQRPSPAPRRATMSPSHSQSGTPSKKKAAPPPPPTSAATSPAPSPRGSMRPPRKSRPAPQPPGQSAPDVDRLLQLGEKGIKDELNRTRQELVTAQRLAPEKSRQGQWKRKKGPAPALPIPPKRQVLHTLPVADIGRELELIEVQQRGLEKQGVRLESEIRDRLEQMALERGGDGGEEPEDSSLPPELEDQVLQLFEIVNEKNDLFRRQAEFMYMKRQYRLEEQQADLEWQIRCLLQKPHRSEEDVKQEEELITRLVEVVEQRNQIVDCLEMDRRREADEDRSVRERMQMLSEGRLQPCSEPASTKPAKSGKSKSKVKLRSFLPKDRTKKDKKDKKKRESAGPSNSEGATVTLESGEQTTAKSKKHSKKKWFS